jgi:hypothetical protein
LTTGSSLSKRRGYSPISAPYYHPKVCGKPAALLQGLFTEVPRRRILRTSPSGCSANFALTEF